jgi:hypothetical protein
MGMNNSNNIVLFPKVYNGPKEVISLEDIDKKIDYMKHFHIQETIANLAPIIFNHLDISGFTFADEDSDDSESLKDGAFLIESLRSIMCKYYGIYHPFQKLSEEVFYPDPNEPETLKVVDFLNIKLKEESTET